MNKEILKVLKGSEKIYVYGAGVNGKLAVNYIDSLLNMSIEAIVVSDGHIEFEEYIYSTKDSVKKIPVLEESKTDLRGMAVVVTLIAGKSEVIDLLEKRGAIIIEYSELVSLNSEYIEYYYKMHNIVIDNNIMKVKNVTLFYPKDEIDREIFFADIGEELAPGVLKDYSFVVDGDYEIKQVHLEEGDVVIEAGANLGVFTCYAASKGNEVIAFEPSKKALNVLLEQQKLYPNKIQIMEVALSDAVGTTTFYESSNCAFSSLRDRDKNASRIDVCMETIDNLVKNGKLKRVDFIKADIEGAERDMLRGAKETLKTMAPKLSICTYHLPDDKEVLERIILEANPKYKIIHKWRKLYAWVPNKEIKQ